MAAAAAPAARHSAAGSLAFPAASFLYCLLSNELQSPGRTLLPTVCLPKKNEITSCASSIITTGVASIVCRRCCPPLFPSSLCLCCVTRVPCFMLSPSAWDASSPPSIPCPLPLPLEGKGHVCVAPASEARGAGQTGRREHHNHHLLSSLLTVVLFSARRLESWNENETGNEIVCACMRVREGCLASETSLHFSLAVSFIYSVSRLILIKREMILS